MAATTIKLDILTPMGPRRRGVCAACPGGTLAGQPQGNCHVDFGLTLARVVLQPIVAVAHSDRRRPCPQAPCGAAVCIGAAALAIALAGSNGALPGCIERRAKRDAGSGWAGRGSWGQLRAPRGCSRLAPNGPAGDAGCDDAGRQPRKRLHDVPDDSTAGAAKRGFRSRGGRTGTGWGCRCGGRPGVHG